MADKLIQIEQIDEVCYVCGIRHIPRWLERLLEDPWLRRTLMPRNDDWINIHMFTKRAFVPLGEIR